MLDTDLSPREVDLVRSAYRVIGDKGVHGISLQDVADDAGVSKGVPSYYFKTKENLILATLTWVLSRVAERIKASLDRAHTPEERVRGMVDAIFVDPEANRRFYVSYLDLVDYAARLDTFKQVSGTFDEIVNGLYAEVARSFAVADLDESAQVVRAIIDGLFVQWLTEQDLDATHARYRETCKRALLAYLGAPVSR
jgi:TetR/AcrR family fatty acid metabolism transcriptional regulator